MANTVSLTLAHPLSAAQAEKLHAAQVKGYTVGDKITVSKDDAVAIINAGYAAGVDPQNHEAVRDALGDKPAAPRVETTKK